MGYGSYTASDWVKLKSSKGLNSHNTSVNVFTRKTADSIYDSRNIKLRESRDSKDSPEAVPIIIGFDVTASMGYLAKELATNAINKTVTSLLTSGTVAYPQIMCAAIGDAKSDITPLQVTQFEADIRMVEQLTELNLEGGGGGNGAESYNLLWYFAARHTSVDHAEKRGKKGYLFTVGDDRCHPEITVSEQTRLFSGEAIYSVSNQEILSEVSERYNTFHIHLDNGDGYSERIFNFWQKLMPGRSTVIRSADVGLLADLIIAVISVWEGADINEALNMSGEGIAELLARPMAFIEKKKETKNIISF